MHSFLSTGLSRHHAPRAAVRGARLAALAVALGSSLALSAQAEPLTQQASVPADAGLPSTSAQAGTATKAAPSPVVSLSALRGRTVIGADGRSALAVVQDFVLSPDSGHVRAVLAVPGQSGLSAVPSAALRLREDGTLLINADRESLLAMPRVDPPAQDMRAAQALLSRTASPSQPMMLVPR